MNLLLVSSVSIYNLFFSDWNLRMFYYSESPLGPRGVCFVIKNFLQMKAKLLDIFCQWWQLTLGWFSTGFAPYGFTFYLNIVIFLLTLANTLPSNFEIVWCQFCFLLPNFQCKNWLPCLFQKKFMDWGFLQMGLFVNSFLSLLFITCNNIFMMRIAKGWTCTVIFSSIETKSQ